MPDADSRSQRATDRGHVTRYAPSPTGLLHLGHVANAVWTWDTARRLGAQVLLRMEDHDRGRSRPEYERRIHEDLDWLGFIPEPESRASLLSGQPSRFRQSDSEAAYAGALATLDAKGLVYGCTCSRSTLARELGDGLVEGQEISYPGTCRDKGTPIGAGVGVRVRLPDEEVTFMDLRLGPQRQRPQAQCGDLLVRDRNGNWTYQFCVTVDDWRHGVTLVVRGEDLLASTGRQILLARLLGRAEAPAFLHHPLIRNEAGEKLAKRDAAAGVGTMREAGLTPAEVVARARSATNAGRETRPR